MIIQTNEKKTAWIHHLYSKTGFQLISDDMQNFSRANPSVHMQHLPAQAERAWTESHSVMYRSQCEEEEEPDLLHTEKGCTVWLPTGL